MITALHPSARYVCLRSAPAVSAREVEDPVRKVVFVTARWGDAVVFVGEIDPKKGFFLGEPLRHEANECFPINADVLGAARVSLVRHQCGAVQVTIPHAATARVTHADRPAAQFDVLQVNSLQGDEAMPERAIELSEGSRAQLYLGALRFDIEYAAAGKSSPRQGLFPEPEVLGFYGLSFAVIGSLLGAMAYFLPSLGLLDDEGVHNEQRYLMAQYLDATAERQLNPDQPLGGGPTEGSGDPGAHAPPAEKVHDVQPSSAGKIPLGSNDAQSRAETIRAAREFGMVSLLETIGTESSAAAWNSEIQAVGGETTGLWGDELGDISGSGLRLSGDGRGTGGPGKGVDIDDIGGLNGRPPGGFIGAFSKPGAPGHKTRVPVMRTGPTTVSGRLLPEVVQRTVRQNYGRFRMCYEKGLVRNPALAGRVEVRFLIDSSGAVAQAMQGASDLPDPDVSSCIVKQFFALSFPQPENGTVSVTYPLALSPAE
ncbi:MAG TPA: AgmX/PglI C-terminal domain-containing protein [Polyangiaceae bacterium]|nr:AgmX/PglI C-terminal domain-containing protein [Polyangiaceae bacterium]